MSFDDAGLGVPGRSPLMISADPQRKLAAAVRESTRRRIIELIRARGGNGDVLECPRCGDRLILLDEPSTYVFDLRDRTQMCSACGAEREVIRMEAPDVDIGGEGGA